MIEESNAHTANQITPPSERQSEKDNNPEVAEPGVSTMSTASFPGRTVFTHDGILVYLDAESELPGRTVGQMLDAAVKNANGHYAKWRAKRTVLADAVQRQQAQIDNARIPLHEPEGHSKAFCPASSSHSDMEKCDELKDFLIWSKWAEAEEHELGQEKH